MRNQRLRAMRLKLARLNIEHETLCDQISAGSDSALASCWAQIERLEDAIEIESRRREQQARAAAMHSAVYV